MKNLMALGGIILFATGTMLCVSMISGCSDDASLVTVTGLAVNTPKKGSQFTFVRVPRPVRDSSITVVVDSVYPSYLGKTNVVHFRSMADTVSRIDMYLAYAPNGDVYEVSGNGKMADWLLYPFVSAVTADLRPPVETSTIINTDRMIFTGISSSANLIVLTGMHQQRNYQQSGTVLIADVTNSTIRSFAPALGYYTKMIARLETATTIGGPKTTTETRLEIDGQKVIF